MDLLFENINQVDDLQIHFIIGRGRSGTTLLSSILNKYEEVLATHENQFMLVFHKKFSKKKKWHKTDIDYILNNLWIKQNMMSLLWKIDMEKLKKTLYHFLPLMNYNRLCKIIYCAHNNFSQTNTIIIDKNPIYSFHVKKWKALFPDAKFIILIRDYRAQYLSMSNNKMKPFLKNRFQSFWNYTYGFLLNETSLTKENSIIIKYENLILNTQNTTTTILSFLKINPHKVKSNSLTYISLNPTDSIIEKGFLERHQNVNKPINPSSISKWKQQLSTSTIKKLETYNGYLGLKFAYPLTQIKEPKPSNVPFYKKLFILCFTKYIFLTPISIQRFLYNLVRKKINKQITKNIQTTYK